MYRWLGQGEQVAGVFGESRFYDTAGKRVVITAQDLGLPAAYEPPDPDDSCRDVIEKGTARHAPVHSGAEVLNICASGLVVTSKRFMLLGPAESISFEWITDVDYARRRLQLMSDVGNTYLKWHGMSLDAYLGMPARGKAGIVTEVGPVCFCNGAEKASAISGAGRELGLTFQVFWPGVLLIRRDADELRKMIRSPGLGKELDRAISREALLKRRARLALKDIGRTNEVLDLLGEWNQRMAQYSSDMGRLKKDFLAIAYS